MFSVVGIELCYVLYEDLQILYENLQVYSMRFRVPFLDQSDCSICYNYN